MNTLRGALVIVALWATTGCGDSARESAEAAKAAADSALVANTPALLNPARMRDTAPPVYRVTFETTEGPFVVEVRRDWAARGADRFYNLVRAGYYDSMYVHRVLREGIAQFGFYRDPRINNVWLNRPIGDDLPKESNKRGTITFAHSGLNTRTAQVFVNLSDNPKLDEDKFVPFGSVVEGMETVDAFFWGYGELAPEGDGPDPSQAAYRGNAYLAESFPALTMIMSARVEEAGSP